MFTSRYLTLCCLQESESKRPAKRQKMTRSVSINTVLQRVGSREGSLTEVAGTAPLTVQEMVEAPVGIRLLDQVSPRTRTRIRQEKASRGMQNIYSAISTSKHCCARIFQAVSSSEL